MIELFKTASRLIEKGEAFVIATIVQTRGSTPQKPGAKMLIPAIPTGRGGTIGTLGGGCVEGDIWHFAQQLFQEKSGPLLREYNLNEDLAARDGLVCGGTMWIFIEPIYPPSDGWRYLDKILQAVAGSGGPGCAIATVMAAPNGDTAVGVKMLIAEDGATTGSLGTAELDQEIGKIGRTFAAYGENKYIAMPDGTAIFVEGFASQPTLLLIGGGHVNKAVSQLAATLGFRIYVIDDRPEFANKARFPEAEELVVAEYADGLNQVPIHANSYIIVATRGHRFDDQALAAAIRTEARFVGLLGSKRKTLMIYKNLLVEGVGMARIEEVHAPVGLDIGAITPEEIAVSILAEIIMVRRGGNGAPLKMHHSQLENVLHDHVAQAPSNSTAEGLR